MQFRHPEILYALLLLIIPILVHLFQLRRFKEERFTNVAFLKKIQLQTRKSNTLKKWLILLTRMLAMAMIVFAFTQPFFTESDNATREKETVIYLDNSFSMQAKGHSGQLLRTAAQDLITHIPEGEKFTLLTNTETYRQTTIENLRNELLKVPYVSKQLSDEAITLKARKEFSSRNDVEKRLIYISDFQGGESSITKDSLITKYYVQLLPTVKNNVSLDSIYISARKAQSFELTVSLSILSPQEINTPVSLYNGKTLVAKGTASFDKSQNTQVIFNIDNKTQIEGMVLIEDPLLSFDNTLYFTINKDKPIKVLSIDGVSSSYLSRIFSAPEFDFTVTSLNSLDFSSMPDYNYIVLNEIEEINGPLVDALSAFAKAGGVTTIILNQNGNLTSYQKALEQLANIDIKAPSKVPKLLTTINYDHPIYSDVFVDRVQNFQYPSLSSSFILQGGDAVLQLEDGSPFLTENSGIYVIAASITENNSNFKNSPLVVPTFYNMARQSLELPKLYFTNAQSNTYDIPVNLPGDAILQLQEINNPENRIIPLQQVKGNKVSITTTDTPVKSGNYKVSTADSIFQGVSYNYSREENILRYRTLENTETAYQTSVETLFYQLKAENEVQSLWKRFVIFALFFLLVEILILKFFK